MEKHLKVSAIEDGTVLDHIPANQLFKVIEILKLDRIDKTITFGTNLNSDTLGSKAIIKIRDTFFKDEEINKIALFAPQAKLNIIHNFKVVEKRVLEVPKEIKGIVKCMNPMCITNHQEVPTLFTTLATKPRIELLCHYCEKITDSKNLKISSKF